MTFEELGIKTKGKSGRFSTQCPNCIDTRKRENRNKECLTVNDEPQNQWWNCNHCGWSGNLAVYEKLNKVYAEAKMSPVKKLVFSKEVTEWLGSKQIPPSVALKLKVYEAMGKDGKHIVCYPYYLKNQLRNVMFRRVVYEKGVSEGPREWQISKEHGTETICWGMDDYDIDHQECIIVEGQTDRMTWVHAGFKNVLSIPMGGLNPNTKNVDKKLEFLNEDFFELTKTAKKFIVCTDNDEVGIYTREVLVDKIGKHRCWKVFYPFMPSDKPQYKDSNEILAGDVKKGLEPLGVHGIKALYETAAPIPVAGHIRLWDIKDEVILMSKEGPKRGYLAGKEYDKFISIKEKLMMVVTGVPSYGKSTWVRDYCVGLAKENDLKWGLFTPENRPVKREYLKIMENYTGQSSNPLYKNSMSSDIFDKAAKWVDERFHIVAPERGTYYSFQQNEKPKTIQNILGYFKILKENYGINGFVIDAFNKLDHQRDSRMPQEEYIARVLDYFLEFLDVENLIGIIVAHPTKMEAKDGNYVIPTFYDIKGSSAWGERIDIGISIHRYLNKRVKVGKEYKYVKDKFASTIVDCNKFKFDELGEPDQIEMYLDVRSGHRFVSDRPYYYKSDTEEEAESNAYEEAAKPKKIDGELPF